MVLGRLRRYILVTLAALLLAAPLSTGPAGASLPTTPTVNVIVQLWNGSDLTARSLVTQLGGVVTADLPVVNGFAATLPSGGLATLAASPAVRIVSPDSMVLPQDTASPALGPPSPDLAVMDATGSQAAGANGQGVTVALVDTGIASVADLAGRLVGVTDLNGQPNTCVNFSSDPDCTDNYGHGTFVAGLIAGNGASSGGSFMGVAPAARLLSVKLAGRDGQSSVSKVLAAIGWVLANKDIYGIRVLNLSLRVDSTLSYRLDPVNLAVERAWAAGLVVVVSAGNQGSGSSTIAKPADDPWVISVGSVDDQGTATLADDMPSSFSSRGPTVTDGLAKPDVAVSGRHLVSLRSPGSAADLAYPYFYDANYRYGSGTSFSAGLVSGAAAALLSANPSATNDRIKYELVSAGRPVPGAGPMDVGSGIPDLLSSLGAGPGMANGANFHPLFWPTHTGVPADFLGPLLFQGSNWQGSNWQGSNWQGSNWQGSNWQGSNWQGSNWQGSNWQGSNWQGSNWQGSNWQGSNWQSAYWQ